jgi:dihydroorotate dehydrogenase (NAD+) catalytic subunit
VTDFEKAAAMLQACEGVVAVEVNVSCPNLEARGEMFSHSATATADAVAATEVCGLPRWAKLSPSAADLVDVAGAAASAGAEAVVLVNTMLGMALDPATGRAALSRGGGGYSGPALLPIAVRAVFDVRAAHPDLPIVGVGGIWRGVDAAELLAAGANAVEVGTATFADPRAPIRILRELRGWCEKRDVRDLTDLIGRAHRAGT